MKKLLTLDLLFSCLYGLFAQTGDPVIMTINDNDIKKSEFEYIWHKNNANNAIDSKSLEEYVDLFVIFKLKVAAAEAAGLDTTASFVNELDGYRKQLTPQYMTDQTAEEAVVEEAYQMMQTYLDLSHILIMVDQYAHPDDTLAAYKKIMDLRKQIVSGKKDFAAIAKKNSQDNTAADGGYLGTTIGSRFIYPFAKVAMTTEIGGVSMPVRSQFGYHLIKVHNRYPVIGQYVSGHIFKSAPFDAPQAVKDTAEMEIKAIYKALREGEDFARIADTDNDDRYVVGKGGKYQKLRGGALPIEYESTIYNLKDGEYSAPFQSKFGWHIVKRFSVEPFPSLEEVKSELKTAIKRDSRANAGQKALIEKLKTDYHYTFNRKAYDDFVNIVLQYQALDNELAEKVKEVPMLASFDNNELTAAKFAGFLTKGNYNIYYLSEAFDKFVYDAVLAYEDSRLEEKYPDFGHLMQEYHDGILLFEISNREVWNKAAEDVEGLSKFFENNKANYTWDVPHYKGAIVYCSDKKLVKDIKKTAKKLPQDSLSLVLKRTFNNDSITYVKVDQGLYAKGEKPIIDKVIFKTGDWEPQEDFPFIVPIGKVLNIPEVYTDVRGTVIADYQTFLENEWIKTLKEKYPYKINEDVLKTVQ